MNAATKLLRKMLKAHELAHTAYVRYSWRPGTETARKDLARYEKRVAELEAAYDALFEILNNTPTEDDVAALAKLIDPAAWDEGAKKRRPGIDLPPPMDICMQCMESERVAKRLLNLGWKKL